MNFYHVFVALVLLALEGNAINIVLSKRNVFVEQGSRYICSVIVKRENAELIPTSLTFSNQIANAIPTLGNYFDFFSYLNQKDVQCYNQAVNNQSYLFPCPFLESIQTQLRTSYAQNRQITQQIEEVDDFKYAYIVDNTLFPYPQGAYTYSSINIDVTTNLQMIISTSYQSLGIRLIYINVTAFLIFLVIFLILVFKTKKIQNKMKNSKTESESHNITTMTNHQEDNDSFIDEQRDEVNSPIRIKTLNKIGYKSEATQYENRNNPVPIQYLNSRIDGSLLS